MRLVLLSDTHNLHHEVTVPDGDVLIHAGDMTNAGELDVLCDFNRWLGTLPHAHKVVIAGNHDFSLERQPVEAEALLTNCIYLRDGAVTVGGVTFYGTPWQPWFMDWAFNLPRGEALREKWKLIPAGIDVLITHTPPHGIRDWSLSGGQPVGCEELRRALPRIQPRLHVFGHIHEAAGTEVHDGTTFVNASICDVGYAPVNRPVVFDLEPFQP